LRPACSRAYEGSARQFDGRRLGNKQPIFCGIEHTEVGPMHGSDFSRATERTPKMSKRGSQTDCERRRWCVPWPYAKSGFCASCAENYSIISPAMSRSPPTLFRCSTSASEWAGAIIWLLDGGAGLFYDFPRFKSIPNCGHYVLRPREVHRLQRSGCAALPAITSMLGSRRSEIRGPEVSIRRNLSFLSPRQFR
jgi:hypothetical protein